MKVLVTGSNGFVGKHIMEALRRRPEVNVTGYDIGSDRAVLEQGMAEADVVIHLAGVNRPQRVEEFQTGNTGFTEEICAKLVSLGRKPKIVLSSSIQAELENPYGVSKRGAENTIRDYCQKTGAVGVVYRLKNLFGKWCRPNYNSVTATFCHNIAHNLPLQISNPASILDLTYIDDVVAAFVSEIFTGVNAPGGCQEADPLPSYRTTLVELAALIQSFRGQRKSLLLPDFATSFVRALYATYLSYLKPQDFAYQLDIKADNRGSLAEFVKQPHFGQIFVSRTKPGITRGNHYHHTKTEKFMVVEGDAVIRFRSILSREAGGQKTENGGWRTGAGSEVKTRKMRTSNVEQPTSNSQLLTPNAEIIDYRVSGRDFRVVDIPPGYTHSIENVGSTDMVVLFWASEIFDPQRPDTYPMTVR